MAQSYKVKKGDTLSGIAKQFGVNVGDISGYKSGNADLIYEGENLNIGSAPKNEAETYVSDVKSELDEVAGGNNSSGKGSSIYDADAIKTDISGYRTKLDESFKKLQGIQTDVYDREYKDRELDKKKERMGQLDSEIAAKRSERDAAINKVRTNPGLSAAQMTGDIKKMTDAANAEINNLISQRNGLAGEYNAELDEIDRVITRESGDAGSEYKYYLDLLTGSEGKLGDYSKALVDELKLSQDEDQFTRQLENALLIAGMRGSGGGTDWSLARDPITGDPLYWYNENGEIRSINGDEETGDDSTMGELEAAVQASQGGGDATQGRWYNPFSWANYFD
jgi:LysM repeat protein